ncbi:Endocytosis and vacuole integrity protein [Friedmanniomyces endolithicus]|nr:Endocytosis and vacuole integrity protein [Friedmanniomyces endolithicus]KAK0303584.1 Endocytosis and vacuole integrity protein [Friedmanniomyces endolithicus]KAK0823643.1 Endocytosis and vacuole integrity protein [Friedmanniomyces endolithicus]
MTAALLANELQNLISEAKRKNGDLKTAAEKSLHDLKALPSTSEQQLAADLSRRPAFIEPFLLACATKTARFAGGGVTSLQRLVVTKGLPKTRLKDTLDAFNACAELGLDVQLRILQALPSLLQNYSDDLKDELLAGALQLCALLQSAKAATVSGVAAATLQQLVSAVFEKVVDEDRKATGIAARHEVPGDGKPIVLRPAAYDAYRMFRDLVLAAEERSTKFVRLTALSPESCLELITSALSANARLFVAHTELSGIIRANLLPAVTRPLSDRLPFTLTIRSLRVMDMLLCRYFTRFKGDFEVVLGLLTQNLDLDTAAPWRRAVAMEVIRSFFANSGCIIDAYVAYDYADDGKVVVQDMMSAFVRLSTEKPAAIGLGHQSSVPLGPGSRDSGSEQATVEAAGGMASVISSALGVTEASTAGISSQWSLPRTPCLDQLDKVEAPLLPETYVNTMVLECLNSLADTLARAVVPLAVHGDRFGHDANGEDTMVNDVSLPQRPILSSRSRSSREGAAAGDTLGHEHESVAPRIRAVAELVDTCWPAILAMCSTYLNAALEEQYYRNLIKAYQRFAQVAGLLRLSTARDALITTLSKSAVPPHIVNATMTESMRSPTTPSTENARVFSNSRGMLSVDSLVSQTSMSSADRRSSVEPTRPTLSTRNLLALRALLNLAIALGPTMDTAFAVVVDALKQADLILGSNATLQVMRQGAHQKGVDAPAAVQVFGAEVNAVEAAASRLLESTTEYPNEAFLAVLKSFIRLLGAKPIDLPGSPTSGPSSPPATPRLKERTFSGLPGISTFAEMQARDYHFVIPKLGALGRLNVARFIAGDPRDSGWTLLIDELAKVACAGPKPREARRAATDVLCSLAAETVFEALLEEEAVRVLVQRRAFAVLLQIVDGIYSEDGELTSVDLEMQGRVLEALRSILERCGESLKAGWMKILAVICSAFERTDSDPMVSQQGVGARIDWDHVSNDLVSVQIGRSAFTALQLVCSDFLAALPQAVIPSMIELLFRFIGQRDDLNMALTTVTIAMAVAERLISAGAIEGIDRLSQTMEGVTSISDLSHMSNETSSAQLVLLLNYLRSAVRETQKEVRNAAFLTLCGILNAHGDQLSPSAWEFLLRSVVLNALSDDAQRYSREGEGPEKALYRTPPAEKAMSTNVISGTSGLVAQYIRTIEQINKLPSLWEMFLNKLEAYLDCQSHSLSEAVYTAMLQVLSQVDEPTQIWTTPVYRAFSMWLKRLPEEPADSDKDDNQGAYLAYVCAGQGLYRLAKQTIGSPQTRKMIDNVYHCVAQSTGPSHGADVNSLSALQSKALELLKNIRTDQATLPTSLTMAAAHLVMLHHEQAVSSASKSGPTFVAVASEAIDWLTVLIRTHTADMEMVDSGAVLSAIRTLKRIVDSKYDVPAKCKGTALWWKASSAAVNLSHHVLGLPEVMELADAVKSSLWTEYAGIAAAIVKGNGAANVADEDEVRRDELADIDSFQTLRAVLVPRVGSPSLPDHIRHAYCRSLFDASIVHRAEPGEVPDIQKSPLKDLQRIRRGRARRVPYSRRERMSYVCFEELIALSCSSEGGTIEQLELAQAAAPLLVLRLAIPIRAYIADHPLRGKRPQPLSELEELLFCFDRIKSLRLHLKALAADPVAKDRTGSTAHLHFLYPLLTRAVAIAGDSWSGTQEVHQPLQSVLQTIVAFP